MADRCTQMRRKLVRHSTLNLATNATQEIRSEWVTEPCNIPLFGDTSGICRSCRAGWTHPQNYPLDTGEVANG